MTTTTPSPTTTHAAHPAETGKDTAMNQVTLDEPWHRPGALAYARTRRRAALHPPITVYSMPADVSKDEDVAVTMRDGVTLRLNLFRPTGPGPFPVILSAHPYGKDSVPTKKRGGWKLNKQFRIMNQPEPLTISDQTSWEAPDPVWWAQQGYAVINLDTRGGGHSEGRGDLLSDQEADDIAEVIAWAAAQPWSNGRVGMLGVSYLALSQYKVAGAQPARIEGDLPVGRVHRRLPRLLHPRRRRGKRLRPGLAVHHQEARAAQHRPGQASGASTPCATTGGMPSPPTCPASMCRCWSAPASPTPTCTASDRCAPSSRPARSSGTPTPTAARNGRPSTARKPARLSSRSSTATYANETCPPCQPLRLEVRDRADHVVEVRDEQEWPLARTDWRQLYLGSDGTLNEHPAREGRITFDLRRNAAAFTYRFDQDTELSGPMTLRLHVAVTGTDDPRLFVGVEKWSHGDRWRSTAPTATAATASPKAASGWPCANSTPSEAPHTSPNTPSGPFNPFRPTRTRRRHPTQLVGHAVSRRRSLRLMIAGRYLQPRNPLFGHFPPHYDPAPGQGHHPLDPRSALHPRNPRHPSQRPRLTATQQHCRPSRKDHRPWGSPSIQQGGATRAWRRAMHRRRRAVRLEKLQHEGRPRPLVAQLRA